ncbi:hypothetical protein FJZ40_05425 [Candidatus Shapirobacteria bacterium]|nr:hypothetical protein [Candidatus Shapirobacteria bacterium]
MSYQEKGIKVFEPEKWPFPVSPVFSDLTERPDLAVEFTKKFPKISFAKFAIADGNILIQDCTPGLNREESDKVNASIKSKLNTEGSVVTFQVVDGLTATGDMVKALPPKRQDGTLILFPGNGALAVKEYLQVVKPELAEGLVVPVQRTAMGKGKFKITVEIPKELPEKVSNILVIDDVVASGQTAGAVTCALVKEFGVLPPIRLACWLMLAAGRDPYYPTGLPYFNSVSTAYIIKGNGVSRPPTNSLSCLLDQTGRYDRTKQEYINRYLPGASQVLDKIKGLIYKGDIL